MSYNISHSEIISGEFSINVIKFHHLELDIDSLPEVSPWDQDLYTIDHDYVFRNSFWWYGEGSRYIENLKKLLSHGKGPVDIILVWEGGDSVSGLRVDEHGNVTEHEVGYVLK